MRRIGIVLQSAEAGLHGLRTQLHSRGRDLLLVVGRLPDAPVVEWARNMCRQYMRRRLQWNLRSLRLELHSAFRDMLHVGKYECLPCRSRQWIQYLQRKHVWSGVQRRLPPVWERLHRRRRWRVLSRNSASGLRPSRECDRVVLQLRLYVQLQPYRVPAVR